MVEDCIVVVPVMKQFTKGFRLNKSLIITLLLFLLFPFSSSSSSTTTITCFFFFLHADNAFFIGCGVS
jgi:hypothetical protein